LRVLMFEQRADVLERRLGFRVQEYGLRQVFRRIPDHPTLAGLDAESLRDWRGEATILPPRVDSTPGRKGYPFTMWCGIEVSRAWRAGCYGNVASVLIEKPATGDFLPIVDGGFNLHYSPLMQYREGKGMILFCQMDVTGRSEDDPAAMRLVANMLDYVDGYSPSQRRSVLYAGDPAGQAHLEQAGISTGEYSGDSLTPDQVLVVGPGGGEQLAPHKEDIANWLGKGGHVLAIGLNGQEAKAFLPLNITTKEAEHICAHFEPPGIESPLAGISPAEVQIRDPRELPLATGGADVIGNGVLAVSEDGSVVFCQLAPWEFDHENLYHVKMTFRRTSFLVTRLLANMGSSRTTQLLSHFSTPVGENIEADDTGRWLTGLYLDKPVETDDPYRFFRW
jgi:beta-galactosidase